MPALDTRAGFVWCTFFHTISRRNAVIHSSAQTCRRDRSEGAENGHGGRRETSGCDPAHEPGGWSGA